MLDFWLCTGNVYTLHRHVGFLAVQSVWNEWKVECIEVGVGSVALLLLLVVLLKGRISEYVAFEAETPIEQLQTASAKVRNSTGHELGIAALVYRCSAGGVWF